MRACDDVTVSQAFAVLQCCVWLLDEMPLSRAVFYLDNSKYRANQHLRSCQFLKNKVNNTPHTLHIFEFFENWRNRRCLFAPDLLLFTWNTARDEGISANSQTQHWRTANTWLAVTSSHARIFFVWSQIRVNLVLFFKPCMRVLEFCSIL